MDEIGGILGVLVCGGLLVVILAALVFLVNKTKEQEVQTQREIESLVKTLPEASRSTFLIQYNSQKKSPVSAVVLALLLGGIGVHHFYLGKMGLGLIYLIFSWTGIPLVIAFFEAFTISHTVHKMNRNIAQQSAAMLHGDVKAVF